VCGVDFYGVTVTGDPDRTLPFWKAQSLVRQNPSKLGGWAFWSCDR